MDEEPEITQEREKDDGCKENDIERRGMNISKEAVLMLCQHPQHTLRMTIPVGIKEMILTRPRYDAISSLFV